MTRVWQRIRRALDTTEFSMGSTCLSDTSGNRKEVRKQNTTPCFARSYKSIFLGKTNNFVEWNLHPGREQICMAQKAPAAQRTLSSISQKRPGTRRDHRLPLQTHSEWSKTPLCAPDTGKYISVFERLSPCSPEMSFLDPRHYSRLLSCHDLNQWFLVSRGISPPEASWLSADIVVSLTEGRAVLALVCGLQRMVPNTQQHTTAQPL